MWKCAYCGKTASEMPEPMKCPNCGLVLGKAGVTEEKYDLLRKIVELNDYDFLIDACAGSGKVQVDEKLIPGSPLIFNEFARIKTPPAKRVFIEFDQKTFKLLKNFCNNSDAIFINGDCNQHLLNLVDGNTRTLVFIDPFGYGIPAIKRSVILKLSETPNTDLLINFSWRIAREMGHARTYLNCTRDNCPSPSHIYRKVTSCTSCPTRRKAMQYARSLDIWWGHKNWMNWGSLKIGEYAKKYAKPLMTNNKVQIIPIPRFKKATYHLIFATKFETLKLGIMRWLK